MSRLAARAPALAALLLAACEAPFTPPVPVASVTVTPDSAVVNRGDSLRLLAVPRDAQDRPLNRPVIWSSSDPRVAVVSATGVVTGLGAGRAAITARADSARGSAGVTVVVPLVALAIDQMDQTLVPGGGLQLTAAARDEDGARVSVAPITWATSDSAVAVVGPDGVLATWSPGVATVTAAYRTWRAILTVEVTTVEFAALSASEFGHTCGVATDGRAFCWGSDGTGQLGNGPEAPSASPVGVAQGLRFSLVATGGLFSCGLSAMTAYCWGSGARGRLGDGTLVSKPYPVAAHTDLRFASVAAGWTHACAVTPEGAAHCWGTYPATGSYATPISPVPAAVVGGRVFSQVTAGDWFTCGLGTDSLAYCWGLNWSWRLGNDTLDASVEPLLAAGTLRFTALVAGDRHVCGLAADGAAWCWGDNAAGQLGSGDTVTRAAPVRVASATAFVTLVAGGRHSCGIAADGTASCWGANEAGQLGTGDRAASLTPVAVAGSLRFTALTAGDAHTCGLATDRVAYCWGGNAYGQVGDGTTVDRLAPTRVAGQSPP